jgi:hypothetical protein
LTASLLTALAAPGGESPDTELDIFAMQPEAQMAYLFGPIENVHRAMDQARAHLQALDEQQQAGVLDAARAAVVIGPDEAVTVDLVRTLQERLAAQAARIPGDEAAREQALAATPADLVEVVRSQDARLSALAAAVASHADLLGALGVTPVYLCCDKAPQCPRNPACDTPPGCKEAPDCSAPTDCTARWTPGSPDDVVDTIRSVEDRVAALDDDQRLALQENGKLVATPTASMWNNKAVLIRYRVALEDLLADSARIASVTRGAQSSDNQELISLESRSRRLRDEIIKLTGMISEYVALFGC